MRVDLDHHDAQAVTRARALEALLLAELQSTDAGQALLTEARARTAANSADPERGPFWYLRDLFSERGYPSSRAKQLQVRIDENYWMLVQCRAGGIYKRALGISRKTHGSRIEDVQSVVRDHYFRAACRWDPAKGPFTGYAGLGASDAWRDSPERRGVVQEPSIPGRRWTRAVTDSLDAPLSADSDSTTHRIDVLPADLGPGWGHLIGDDLTTSRHQLRCLFYVAAGHYSGSNANPVLANHRAVLRHLLVDPWIAGEPPPTNDAVAKIMGYSGSRVTQLIKAVAKVIRLAPPKTWEGIPEIPAFGSQPKTPSTPDPMEAHGWKQPGRPRSPIAAAPMPPPEPFPTDPPKPPLLTPEATPEAPEAPEATPTLATLNGPETTTRPAEPPQPDPVSPNTIPSWVAHLMLDALEDGSPEALRRACVTVIRRSLP